MVEARVGWPMPAADGVETSITSAADALQDIFGALSTGGVLDLGAVDNAGGEIVDTHRRYWVCSVARDSTGPP